MKYWRQPTWADCEYVAANMRKEDVLEVSAFNHTPEDALYLGLEHSAASYTLVNPKGEPIAVLGVTPQYNIDLPKEDTGMIWLLGTPGIEKYGYRFLRYSKEALQELYDKTDFELFFNYTHTDNFVHHKWLKWLGFKFIRRVNIGNSGFIEFARLKG
jgi:hypothetical protein